MLTDSIEYTYQSWLVKLLKDPTLLNCIVATQRYTLIHVVLNRVERCGHIMQCASSHYNIIIAI